MSNMQTRLHSALGFKSVFLSHHTGRQLHPHLGMRSIYSKQYNNLCILILRATLLLIFLTLTCNMFCQTKISGRVLDKKGQPAECFAALSLPGETIVKTFTNVDENGNYLLTFTGKADSICIRVYGFMINSYTKTVPNKTQEVNFTVEQKEFDLKEIDIKATPVTVKGDTTDYLVSSYTQQGDRVIGDVLKKVPGIEVSEGGKISYNGKAISKFYVEEMDMLQGRYGLAVNNLNADDVSKIQIMEHHQPVKMLRNRSYSNDIAINLKLKDKAKGTYALSTALGGGVMEKQHNSGVKGLWDEELTGMYFGKDTQTMQTYKGNNSGNNILAELTNQYGGNAPSTISRVNILKPGTPNLPQKRYMDNQTHALSCNGLYRFNKEKELATAVVYTHDKQQREGYTFTELYRPEVVGIGIHESILSKEKSNSLEFSQEYTNNSEQYYTSNKLSVQTSWDNDMAYGQTHSMDYNAMVNQDMHETPLSISDAMVIQRLIGDNIFRFNLHAGYAQSSQQLNITELDSLFRMQELMSRTLSFKAFTSYQKEFRHIQGEYGLSTNANIYGENGTLTGVEGLSAEDCKNDIWYGIYRLNLFQTYKYQYRQGYATLVLPIALDIQSSNDCIRQSKKVFFHPVIQPTLSADYNWNIYNTIHGNVRFEQQIGDLNNLFKGYIMENYRTILRSQTEHLLSQKVIRFSAGYRYSNAIHQIHFNTDAGYNRTWRNQIGTIVYDGIYSNYVMQDLRNNASTYTAGLGISKNFSRMKSYIKLNSRYNHSENPRLIDGQRMQYLHHTCNFNLSGSITPVKWMTVVTGVGGMLSKSMTEQTKSGTLKDYMGRISIRLYPSESLTLSLSGEGTYDNWGEKDNIRYFSDAKIQYSFKNATLTLEGNNLFNQKKYVMNSNNNMDIYHLEYGLRPRNYLVKLRFKIL